jgi:hypothetical protein
MNRARNILFDNSPIEPMARVPAPELVVEPAPAPTPWPESAAVHGTKPPSDAKGETRQDRASWYAPGLSDGIGDRLLMFDNTGAPSFELLRFKRVFAQSRKFEAQLRHRVSRLEGFSHPAVAKVRAVEWLGDGDGLALISTHTPGRRLTDVLTESGGPGLALELIRQLTPVLAALHQQGAGIAHGAITADRIIVTPSGRLVLIEHVLGAALESLWLPGDRFRSELGIVLPPGGGVIALNGRTDLAQLAFVALSLLLGRPIDPLEYPEKGTSLIDEYPWSRPEGRAAPPYLRVWLEQALQLGGRAFPSTREASVAVQGLLPGRGPEAVAPRALHPFRKGDEAGEGAADLDGAFQLEPQTGPMGRNLEDVSDLENDQAIFDSVFAAEFSEAPADDDVGTFFAPEQAGSFEFSKRPAVAAAESTGLDPAPDRFLPRQAEFPDTDARRFKVMRWLVAGLAILAIGEAGVVAGLIRQASSRPGPPPAAVSGVATAATATSAAASTPRTPAAVTAAAAGPGRTSLALGSGATGTLAINSDPLALRAFVDGKEVGRTPVELPVPVGDHVVAVTDGTTTTTRRMTVTAGGTSALMASIATVAPGTVPAAAAAPVPAGAMAGWLSITTPLELQVREGGKLLGATSVDHLMLPAGRHQLELSNTAVGFQTVVAVDIRPGQTASTTVSIPNGSLSINALPWANVTVDGKALTGTTPFANLDVPVGSHEIIWRHPQLGERRQTVVVTAKGPVRVVMDLTK